MHCYKCGTEMPEGSAFCPSCGEKAKKGWKKPPFLLRILMRLISLVLCLVLTVSLIATVLLIDVRTLTSSGGIEKLVNALTETGTSQQTPTTAPAMGAFGVLLRDPTDPTDPTEPTEPQPTIPDDFEIPGDLDTSDTSVLTDYIFGFVQDMMGEDVNVTPDQVQTLVEESTLKDFLAEKASSLVQDMLTGENNTTFSAEEIMQLVDDNQSLIEDIFDVEITDEIKQNISVQVQEAVDDGALEETLRTGIEQVMQEPVPGMDGMTVSDLMAQIQKLSQSSVLFAAIAICVVLAIMIVLLNYYYIPRGLRQAASSCMTAGVLLSAPLAILHFSPTLLSGLLPETAELLSVIDGVTSVMAPYHYGLLIIGTVLTVLAFFWKLFTKKK